MMRVVSRWNRWSRCHSEDWVSQICGLRAVFDITTSDAKGAYTQTDSRGGGGDLRLRLPSSQK